MKKLFAFFRMYWTKYALYCTCIVHYLQWKLTVSLLTISGRSCTPQPSPQEGKWVLIVCLVLVYCHKTNSRFPRLHISLSISAYLSLSNTGQEEQRVRGREVKTSDPSVILNLHEKSCQPHHTTQTHTDTYLGYLLCCTMGRISKSVLGSGSNSCVKRSEEERGGMAISQHVIHWSNSLGMDMVINISMHMLGLYSCLEEPIHYNSVFSLQHVAMAD